MNEAASAAPLTRSLSLSASHLSLALQPGDCCCRPRKHHFTRLLTRTRTRTYSMQDNTDSQDGLIDSGLVNEALGIAPDLTASELQRIITADDEAIAAALDREQRSEIQARRSSDSGDEDYSHVPMSESDEIALRNYQVLRELLSERACLRPRPRPRS